MIGAEVKSDLEVFPTATSGPTALRILLGGRLRQLREASGITRAQAGHAIRASDSKISRMELGRVAFKERDVADLLTLYGITEETERATFTELGRQANKPGWWHRYSDILPSWFELYVGLEVAAALVRTYEVQFVPGLLQTPEYAREVTLLAHTEGTKEEVTRRVELRMERQRRLTVDASLKLWAVVDEAVLHRPLGGPKVMRAQLEHLVQMAKLPNISIQILPFAQGGHAAAGGPFSILRFAEPDLPDIVYLEQLSSALYLDDPREVNGYMQVMDRLCIEAAAGRDTVRLLHEFIGQ